MIFRNQCFFSKHCQTKYNVHRDKVACLERITHHPEAVNEAAKHLQSSHFNYNLRGVVHRKEKAITERSA